MYEADAGPTASRATTRSRRCTRSTPARPRRSPWSTTTRWTTSRAHVECCCCTVVSSTLIYSEVDRPSNARSQICDLIAQVVVGPARRCDIQKPARRRHHGSREKWLVVHRRRSTLTRGRTSRRRSSPSPQIQQLPTTASPAHNYNSSLQQLPKPTNTTVPWDLLEPQGPSQDQLRRAK